MPPDPVADHSSLPSPGGRTLIVVTGPHRSGTSSIAMILEALGLDFGHTPAFYEADEWNRRGYYERRDVIDLNSRLITGLPRTRGTVTSILSQIMYVTLPSRRTIDRRAQGQQEEIADLAGKLEDIAVKDPRFCVTLHAWAPFVRSVVVCLRHPDSVARSLYRRQRVPRSLALRFWEYHAEGLLDLPVEHALYVDFDALSRRESATDELAAIVSFFSLDLTREQSLHRYEARFEPSLQHFDATSTDPLPPSTRDLWEALRCQRPST